MVSFDDAIHVFSDPNALFTQDRVDAGGELRWHVVGSAGGMTILLVVHTVTPEITGEKIRIISARRATGRERRRYEENCY
jgi:uncharacterized DUF497 family protein